MQCLDIMDFEYKQEFKEYLPENGVLRAVNNYLVWMKLAAQRLGRCLGPADLFDNASVESLLNDLRNHHPEIFNQDSKLESNLRSALRKYARMVDSNYRGLFWNAPPPSAPVAQDARLEDFPVRVRQEIYRVVRDTQVTRQLKRLYEYRCQVCTMRLEIEPGQFYVEAHHLKPLGAPFNSPDISANIICVCPNCHTLFDYSAMPIQLGTLQICLHSIGPEYIAHHNQRCGRIIATE